MALPERARPVMEQVRDAIRETVQLAVLDGRFNVYIGKVDGGRPLTLASEIGRRLPAHATGLGKMLLSDLSWDEYQVTLGTDDLERFTEHTITDKQGLFRHLADIRKRGYSADHEELTEGVHCIAVPIRDHSTRVVAAMSVSAPKFRFNRDRKREALNHLQRAAAELSTALGGKT